MMKKLIFILAFIILSAPSFAQGNKAGPPPSTAVQGLGLAIQQLSVSASLYADEMQREIKMRDVRIQELEKLCGDACKKAE